MTHFVGLFAALYAFWLLLSGYFTPFLLLAGAGSALAVSFFNRRLEVVGGDRPPRMRARMLLYWPWLFKEIVKAAWDVTKIIVDPRLPISPTLVRFRPSQRSEVGLVTHANSITLTPGTITVEADADEFLVHGITRAAAEATIDSEMDRRVSVAEGRA